VFLKRSFLTGLAVVGALTLHGADLTWDADTGTTGAQDGAGTWNTALNNWWDGAGNVTWNNATPDNAIFGTATAPAGNVTVPSNTTNTVGNITFNALGGGGHNIAAGSSTTSKLNLSGTPTITVASGVLATNLVVLSGTSFTKMGAGLFTLKPGAPNVNSGPTVVGEGTLIIGSTAGRLLIPGNLTITNGAIAQIGANEQIADSAMLTVDGGTFDLTSRSETVNGVLLDNDGVIFSTSSGATLTSTTGFDVRSGMIVAGLAGSGALVKTTGGTVWLTNSSATDSYTGGTLITAGILESARSGTGLGIPTGIITITNTGMLRIQKDNQIALSATVNVAGGTFELLLHNDNAGTVILDNGGQILNGGSTSKTLTVSTNLDFRNGLCATVLGGTGGLVKSTPGTVTLTLDNSYSGGTLISGGVLQIGDGGIRGKMGTGPVTNNAVLVLNHSSTYNLTNVISGTGSMTNLVGLPSITVDNSYSGATVIMGGTLFAKNASGSATGSGAVAVNNGTLGGAGIIGGSVNVQSGGTLAPGNSAIGTLTINNTLTLGGTCLIEVNTGASPNTDQVAGTTTVHYGGTLQIVNQGAPLTTADTFQIFPAGTRSGTFANIVPANPDNNPGLTWNTSTLTTDGILRISSAGGGPDTTPTTLVSSVGGGNLTLSWPTDHTGWTLQTQTNSRSTGLNSTWFNVSGSTTTNQVIIPVDSAQPTVFYRLMLAIP